MHTTPDSLIPEVISRLVAARTTGDFPVFVSPLVVHLDDPEASKKLGVTIAAAGSSNYVIVEKDQPTIDLQIDAGRASNTAIVIGKSAAFTAGIKLIGNNSVVCMSGVSSKQGRATFRIHIDGSNVVTHFGSGFTSVSSHINMIGDDCVFSTGPDCMFSWGITLHNYDHHTIFDIESGAPINHPGDIRIGRHVWLGQDVINFGATEVGEGSVIAARSMIGKSVPAYSLAGGAPTRVLRSNISWTRERYGDAKAIARISETIKR